MTTAQWVTNVCLGIAVIANGYTIISMARATNKRKKVMDAYSAERQS